MTSVKQEPSDQNSLMTNEIVQQAFNARSVTMNNTQQESQLITFQRSPNPIIIASSGMPLGANLQSPIKSNAMGFSLSTQQIGNTQLNLNQVPVNVSHGQNLQFPTSQAVTMLANTSHSNVNQLTINPPNASHANVNMSNVSQTTTNPVNINQLSQRLIRISVSQGGAGPQTFIINNAGQIVSQLSNAGQTSTQTSGGVTVGNAVLIQQNAGTIGSQAQSTQPTATTSVPGQSIPIIQRQLLQKSHPVSTPLVVGGNCQGAFPGKAVIMNSLPANLQVKHPILPKGASPEKQVHGQSNTRSVFVPITMASVGSTSSSTIQIRSIAPRLTLASGSSHVRQQQQLAPKAIAPQPTQLLIPTGSGTAGHGAFLLARQATPGQLQGFANNVVKIQGPGGQLMQALYVPQAISTAGGIPQAAVIVGPAVNDPNKEELQLNGDPSDSKIIKKPCNCTKSQCLKLYCDCFANGEFCSNCNCNNCSNNIEHESERSKAIKACLDRNPHAFHPKIGKGKGEAERRHTKGCHCKRSGCLKNYCECYEAKILCSTRCKCTGCKNFEESPERKTLMHLADAAEVRVLQQNAARSKLESQLEAATTQSWSRASGGERLPAMFITNDVAQATCDCIMAQAEEAEVKRISNVRAEQLVLDEFSRCLLHIIHSAQRSGGHNT